MDTWTVANNLDGSQKAFKGSEGGVGVENKKFRDRSGLDTWK